MTLRLHVIQKVRFTHELFLFVILILFSLIIAICSPGSFNSESLLDILKSSSTYMVMAIGVLIVMISGGIDVSFTSIAAVAAYVSVYILNTYAQGNIVIAFFIAGIVGAVLGIINSIFISLFKLPTLIVTLATSNIFYGLLLEHAPTAHISKVPEFFTEFGAGRLISFAGNTDKSWGLSNLAIIAIILLIIFSILLRYTGLGRNIYAMGSAKESAQRAGISIWKTQFFVYLFAGFLAGISSILNTSLISYVNPFNIQSTTMDVIAAVVLGGAALNGGKGSVIGTFLGVILLFMVKTSLIQLGVPSTWDSLIVGSILLISISIPMLRYLFKK